MLEKVRTICYQYINMRLELEKGQDSDTESKNISVLKMA